jgi:3-oxoacyl-[acyl-carrier protein] reductase
MTTESRPGVDTGPSEQVAVVTGGASGIGLATVGRLGRAGYTVVLTDKDEAAAARQAETLAESGLRVEARRMDVSVEADVDGVLDGIVEDMGSLDLMVNNAGITTHVPIEDLTLDDWRRVLGVDLEGVFLCLRAAGRIMLRQGGGSIVNIASIAWDRGVPGRAPYAVSKAGVVALTKVAAVEWSSRGIRVNAVAPGYIDTPLLRAAYDRGAIDERDVLARIPAGRVAQVGEIAEVVAFLGSQAASYITGQTIVADGGFLVDYGVGLAKRR